MKSISYYGGKEIVDEEILESIKNIETGDDNFSKIDTSLNYDTIIDGKLVNLSVGNCLGSGGEGRVFECNNLKDYAIKIYFEKNITKIREEKIRLMVDNYLDSKDLSWPRYLVLNNNRFVGFLMRRVPENYEAITPDDIGEINDFFDNNKTNTIKVLINICKILEKLHENHVVFCDIKFENFLINRENYDVMAVDLDGVQVDKYPCYVTSKYFNAPELYMNINDEDVDETVIANNFYHQYYSNYSRDYFSFASLAFQFLMGQTPYSMKNHTNEVENLKKLNFPYSPDDMSYMMERAIEPKINTWAHLPMFMRKAFCRCFNTTQAKDRLQIKDWLLSLNHYLLLLEENRLEKYDSDCLSPISTNEIDIKTLANFELNESLEYSARGFTFNSIVKKLSRIIEDNCIVKDVDERYLKILSEYLRHKSIVRLNREYIFKLDYNLGFLKKVRLINDVL